MILFASKHALQTMTRRAESAESDMVYWKMLADEYLNALTETDAQCDLLLDALDDAANGIDLLAGIARQQEDEIARLSADLALAYQTRDDAMLQIGTQKIAYDAQLRDRNERIADLEAKLRKRQNKAAKTEPPVSVPESEAQA